MSAAFETIESFHCPTCTRALRPGSAQAVACPSCGWQGEAWLFRPLRPRSDEPETALPDDAVCVHHPTKKAIAVCAGTGDYVCALCAVDIEGATYSVAYLDGPGKEKLTEASRRYFQRPDSGALGFVALSILVIFLSPLFVPCAVHQYVQMIRLRRQSPIYRRLVGGGRVFFITLGLLATIAFTAIAILGLTLAYLEPR